MVHLAWGCSFLLLVDQETADFRWHWIWTDFRWHWIWTVFLFV